MRNVIFIEEQNSVQQPQDNLVMVYNCLHKIDFNFELSQLMLSIAYHFYFSEFQLKLLGKTLPSNFFRCVV